MTRHGARAYLENGPLTCCAASRTGFAKLLSAIVKPAGQRGLGPDAIWAAA